MQNQHLTASMTDLDWRGGGVLRQNFMIPSGLTTSKIGDVTDVRMNRHFYEYLAAKSDVTGSHLDADVAAYRLACVLYICLMPASGVRDAFEHIKDTFNWHVADRRSYLRIEPLESHKAKVVKSVKASPLQFDED